MTHVSCSRHEMAAFLAAVCSAAIFSTACNRPASSPQSVKAGCVGCSADGKTPRIVDGHPDLNGYWNGAAPNPNARGGGAVAGAVLSFTTLRPSTTRRTEQADSVCQMTARRRTSRRTTTSGRRESRRSPRRSTAAQLRSIPCRIAGPLASRAPA